jgi:Ca2+-transporting ATPase
VLRTVPLPLPDLLFCLALGLIVLPAVEVEKWLVRRRYLYSDDAPRRQYRR